MYLYFFLCCLGLILTFSLHIWSLEHKKLERRYGRAKGKQIGRILAVSANLLQLLFLMGFWLSFQPRFVFKFGGIPLFVIFGHDVYLSNFIISLLPLILGFWLLMDSERRPGEETLMGHVTPKKIVTSGSYGVVRHPQYLGSNLFHLGMSILLGGFFSLVVSPLYFLYNFLAAKKEEEELVREIGEEYERYQKKVPMFIPRLRR